MSRRRLPPHPDRAQADSSQNCEVGPGYLILPALVARQCIVAGSDTACASSITKPDDSTFLILIATLARQAVSEEELTSAPPLLLHTL